MRRALLAAIAAFAVGCSGTNAPSGPGPGPPPPPSVSILAGAGDIGECSSPGPEATARLLDRISGTIFTAGDNAYPDGSAAQFRDCYEPNWGRHKARTRPTPCNHDYTLGNANADFDYFGSNAGPRGVGYYSYTVGTWRIFALNSEFERNPSAASAQAQWLRDEIAQNPTQCSAAIWHKPLFTSGPNGDNPHMRDTWRILYEYRQSCSGRVVGEPGKGCPAGHQRVREPGHPSILDAHLEDDRSWIVGAIEAGG